MLKNDALAKMFEPNVKFMSSAPSLAIVMRGKNVISRWREMIGKPWPPDARNRTPGSLRARFGRDEIGKNAVHGAASTAEVVEQLNFLATHFKSFGSLMPK